MRHGALLSRVRRDSLSRAEFSHSLGRGPEVVVGARMRSRLPISNAIVSAKPEVIFCL